MPTGHGAYCPNCHVWNVYVFEGEVPSNGTFTKATNCQSCHSVSLVWKRELNQKNGKVCGSTVTLVEWTKREKRNNNGGAKPTTKGGVVFRQIYV
jgi:hypothetical protein